MEDAKNIKKGPAPFYPLEDGTAGEQLHKAMKRYALVPGTIAFTDAHIEVDITYAEYFEMSVRLAEAMKRYGLNTNHRIVVCSENSLQFFMPVLGALFIGVAVAPANDIYNERELLNSMGISQPTVVFVSKKGLQKILNVQKKLPIIQKIIIMDSKTDYQGFQSMYTFVTSHLPPGFNEYDFVPESFDRDKTIALIMNSSGSTGLPKGVALPHRTACVRFSHARDPIFGNQIIPDTAILSVVPFHHGFGMFTTLGYLICGFRVVLMYRFEEELFLRSLQDYKIQSALLVPTLFSFFAKSTLIDKYDLSNLHEIASGGAPLSKEVGEAVAKRFHLPGIRQGYGLTETTSAILITPEGDDKPGAVGKVVPFFEAKVVDLDTGKTLGVNQRGELCVRGPMIMSGYVNNPEATNALIDKDGWLHSGDIAYWDEDEHFFIVDRLKSLIKYKGYQVAPAELESILLQHPNIFDAGVAGLPDDDAGELPAAVVVLEHGKTMTEKEIVDYVASQVTTAKKLRGGVVFVDEVPKGLTGKLDARKIREILIKAKKGGKIAVGSGEGRGSLLTCGDVEENPGPMTEYKPTVRLATRDDVPRAVRTLAAAFADYPATRHTVDPDRHIERVTELQELFLTRVGLDIGKVWVADDGAAVAVWTTPESVEAGAVFAEIGPRMAELSGSRLAAQQQMEGLLAPHRPKEPAWFLATVGVSPDHQGKGLGSAVVLPGVEAAERAGVPAFLETSAPRNLPFYERLGFTVTADVEVPEGPRTWCMTRKPGA